MSTVLQQLVAELDAGRLRIIDLTQPLGPDTPVIGLPPIFAASPGVTIDDFVAAFDEAVASQELTTIVAKVDAKGPAGFVTDLALLENRFEFQRWLRKTAAAQPMHPPR